MMPRLKRQKQRSAVTPEQERATTSLRITNKGVVPVLPTERRSLRDNAFWRSLCRRLLTPVDCPLRIDITGQVLGAGGPDTGGGGTVMTAAVTAGCSAHRTPELLEDDNDDVVLHIQDEGRRFVSQRDRDVTVEPGGAVLTSNADTSRIVLPGAARFVCIAVPLKQILTLAPRAEDAIMKCLQPRAGILRLLRTYLGALEEEEALRQPELRSTVALHIYELFALAIGAARDGAEVAAGDGVRAARLRAVKADIASNLEHGDVSPEALARRQEVTTRYIHKLFELEGTTMSRFKLGLRLARVHGMLVSAGSSRLTISEMAYRAGFTDLSTFNREFRRHFGMTPSELRMAHT